MFHSSISGAWKIVWWGLSPLWRRDWLTRDIYFKNCITKPCQIHQNESNTFSKLFLLKWLFLWLETLVYRWTKGTSMKLALLVCCLWSTLLAVKTYNLSCKLTTQTHYQLQYPLQEHHFPTPLRHAEKQQLHWNWATLPLLSYALQPPKFNVDNPT